jgi:hypothetical protein
MTTYLNIFAMQANANYIQQVTVACRIAAQNVINEATNFPNDVARRRWASDIVNGSQSLLSSMASACAMNSTLQAGAPAGPWLDSDIQFVVNSLVDIQSAGAT